MPALTARHFRKSRNSPLEHSIQPIQQFAYTARKNSMEKMHSPDFVLELTASEWESLRSQIVILKTGRGRYAFKVPIWHLKRVSENQVNVHRPWGV